MQRRITLNRRIIVLFGLMLFVVGPAWGISSSNSGADAFTGIDINALVGADRFYDAGFTGAGAILANIEAGHIWNQHVTLGHVSTFVTGTGALGSTDAHATSVGQSMGGRSPSGEYPSLYHRWGIAYGAELWSGAIATSISLSGSFGVTNQSVASVYSQILQTGVNGLTADVFNSSWGSSDDPTGTHIMTIGIDGLIKNNGTVGVFAAGNSGPSSNTVLAPASGYNSISVGAVGTDTNSPPYQTVSSFSSRGPQNFYHAGTNTVIPAVRAEVDIVSPGENLTLATYTTTGKPQDRPYIYKTNQAGTSFSAPLVAGGAALLVGAGKNIYTGNPNAIDGRVIKAALLNSADKLPGWTNGQIASGGTITTSQSLDWSQGAGRMNLSGAFDQYVLGAQGGSAGTADVPGLAGGDLGNVKAVGWDFGQVSRYDENLYFIDQPLLGETTFSVTLSWFIDRYSGSLADFSGAGEQRFTNLNLRVFSFDNLNQRNILSTVGLSQSMYNTVEHLYFDLPASGYYGLGVSYMEDLWNFNGADTESFGLAWYGTADPQQEVPHAGDANNDGFVDVGDLGILSSNWGDSGASWEMGDFNDDELVDVGDLGVLAGNWGWSRFEGGSSAYIPEPAGFSLLILGWIALFRTRRC